MTHHAFVSPVPGIPAGSPFGGGALRLAGGMLLAVSSACAGAAPGATADVATEAEWQALAAPRPAPLPGAVRLSFSGVELPDEAPWSFAGTVGAEVGLSELVVAGLLRRPDVTFVERRRFSAAVEAERAGDPRPPGAPRAGISPGAELAASAVWLPLPARQVSLEVRLLDTESGAVVGTGRRAIPADADVVSVARTIVAAIVAALDERDRLPAWDDPLAASAAPAAHRPSGVTDADVRAFLVGLSAEERWNWEAARRSYEVAAENRAFFEAGVALTRTARLRLGGTLGES